MPTILVSGGMGDELGTTAVIRELKRQRPDRMIRIGEISRPELFRHNPYLNYGDEDGKVIRVYSYEPKHKGTLTEWQGKMLGCELENNLPELYFPDWELLRGVGPGPFREIPENSVAIDVGAGWWSRRWPEVRFAIVAREFVRRGWRVYLVGTEPFQLEHFPKEAWNVAKIFDSRLRRLALLLSKCRLFVGNDSGLYHLAAAVGTPQVLVSGVTRRCIGPYRTTVQLVPPTECFQGCYKRCKRPPIGENHCLEEINVNQVLEAAEKALQLPRGEPLKPISYHWSDNALEEVLLKVPNDRIATFGKALELYAARGGKVIVETGAFRSWDAGGSTVVFGAAAERFGGRVFSIDKDHGALYRAHMMCGRFADKVSFLPGHSIGVLDGLVRQIKIDLLYLDSMDATYQQEPYREHQRSELETALPALHEKSIVLLDDDERGKPWQKAQFARARLQELGWKCLMDEYQSLWVRGGG